MSVEMMIYGKESLFEQYHFLDDNSLFLIQHPFSVLKHELTYFKGKKLQVDGKKTTYITVLHPTSNTSAQHVFLDQTRGRFMYYELHGSEDRQYADGVLSYIVRKDEKKKILLASMFEKKDSIKIDEEGKQKCIDILERFHSKKLLSHFKVNRALHRDNPLIQYTFLATSTLRAGGEIGYAGIRLQTLNL